MKICAIICEYNPFHNGHLYQLREAKTRSGADAVVCIMSGNFVQRGEGAIIDKFTRAKHAVLAGADAVLELPVSFATANAELFAKGSVHLLSSIHAVQSLCFGAEHAEVKTLLHAARLLNDESPDVSAKIKAETAKGVSYAKARATAYEDILPENMLTAPNTILAVEYARAILAANAAIELLPIARTGGGYKDDALQEDFSSATAIRKAISEGKSPKNALPSFVLADLPQTTDIPLDLMEKQAILRATKEELSRVCDCTEGLENAFKKAAVLPKRLEETLTSARYTASRIRRIALHALLGVDENLIREGLTTPLYLRLLAAKKERKDVLAALSQASFPLLSRAHDEDGLQGTSKEFFKIDSYADQIYALLHGNSPIEKRIFI